MPRGTMQGKWAQPRKALIEGQVVFFPRTPVAKVYSIVSWERKKGMKFKVVSTIYQDCPGSAAWRNE